MNIPSFLHGRFIFSISYRLLSYAKRQIPYSKKKTKEFYENKEFSCCFRPRRLRRSEVKKRQNMFYSLNALRHIHTSYKRITISQKLHAVLCLLKFAFDFFVSSFVVNEAFISRSIGTQIACANAWTQKYDHFCCSTANISIWHNRNFQKNHPIWCL